MTLKAIEHIRTYLNIFERLEFDQAEFSGFGAGVRICAVLLSPVTPGLSAKILAEFGLGQGESWRVTHGTGSRGWLLLPHAASESRPALLEGHCMEVGCDPWTWKYLECLDRPMIDIYGQTKSN